MGPSGGNGKTGFTYMGSLTQGGDTGDMNKSIVCSGHTRYLVFSGREQGAVKSTNITSDNGSVTRYFLDTASVYSSYLKKNVDAKPWCDVWKIEGCKKSGTTITITCPGSWWLAYFVYGVD